MLTVLDILAAKFSLRNSAERHAISLDCLAAPGIIKYHPYQHQNGSFLPSASAPGFCPKPIRVIRMKNHSTNNNNSDVANRNIHNYNFVTTNDASTKNCNKTAATLANEQPDPNNIKMFVGQVPKSMDEIQLYELFQEFGRVYSINVLRDKVTGLSKGCCFVTFFTRKAALKAQDALHNIKTLNGMHHPIQMKPADSENRNGRNSPNNAAYPSISAAYWLPAPNPTPYLVPERKLFVGMLNKKYNEQDVRQLFSGHGTIEECTVLRDQNGQSKGCAFVTFATKQAAIGAIKGLHQSQTMEGCSAPLVVKFADTQKDKEQKKFQQMHVNLWGLPTNGLNMPLTQTAATMASPILPNPPQQQSPFLATDAISPTSLQIFQQLQGFQTVGLQQQLLQGLGAQTDSSPTAAAAGLLGAPISMQNIVTLAAMAQPTLTATQPTPPVAQSASQSIWSGTDALTSAYAAAALPQIGGTATAYTTTPLATPTLTTAISAAAGKQIEGPEGCNLFIYHLPQEFTDVDLASTFLPFGIVVSAKVFIDKQTNLSKCFGFVSYDNPNSAQAAIQAMHGFQIGAKRLKVQLKRSKDSSKPY